MNHGGLKRARSRKRRIQPKKAYSSSGLLYSESGGFRLWLALREAFWSLNGLRGLKPWRRLKSALNAKNRLALSHLPCLWPLLCWCCSAGAALPLLLCLKQQQTCAMRGMRRGLPLKNKMVTYRAARGMPSEIPVEKKSFTSRCAVAVLPTTGWHGPRHTNSSSSLPLKFFSATYKKVLPFVERQDRTECGGTAGKLREESG